MQVSDAKLPTQLPKKSRAWTHQPQPRGFPTTLRKLDKRRKKPMEENPKNPNAKFLAFSSLFRVLRGVAMKREFLIK